MKNLYMLLCILVITIPLLIYGENSNKAEINKQVHAINGEVISIDGLGLFEHDPLPWGGKGTTKYKFLYKQNGQLKTGYVMFSFGETWIMNIEEVK
jgi:hypothetical protein